ncbi:MAG: PEGA domain-containing protein [Polyangiaceae bacterium]|nr:PEGA domain-containing protein [Polyangiaceae bacterium]
MKRQAHRRQFRQRSVWLLPGATLLSLFLTTGCAHLRTRTAVDLSVDVQKGSPGSALVYIDDQYIGSLKEVARRGIRLPGGWHRIAVKKDGYFPWDARVKSDRKAIHLDVDLVRLPSPSPDL